jgi:hypothetical protein
METTEPTNPKSPQPSTRKRQRRGTTKTPPLTAHQRRAIELFKAELVKGGTKPIKEILRQAGYAEESVRQMVNIMAGIRPHLDPFIEKMEKHRERVMQRMEKKLSSASYADAVRSLDVLTHNMRLLSGKSTDNHAILIEDRRRELDQLIDE